MEMALDVSSYGMVENIHTYEGERGVDINPYKVDVVADINLYKVVVGRHNLI